MVDREVPNEPQAPAPPDAGPRRITRLVDHQGPVHDLDAEAALLSAVLTDAIRAWPEAAGVGAAAFYWPAYGHVFTAMESLAADGEQIHVTTVSDRLRRMGLLELVSLATNPTITATAALSSLLAMPEADAGRAKDFATVITRLAAARRLRLAAGNLMDAAQSANLEAALPALEQATQVLGEVEAAATTWNPVDLAELLAGGLVPLVPTLLRRSDGEHLLYEGRIHSFNAEPESGKSLLATLLCAEEIKAGRDALYIDFEADAESVIERVLAFGVTADSLVSHFVYVRPDDPLDLAAQVRIEQLTSERNFSVCVVDGVAEAMMLGGWDENVNAEVAAFLRALPRRLERTGAAVVLIDHVVKNPRERVRGGRGAGHKLAGITVSYGLEVAQPFGRGKTGRARLVLEKDRGGWLRSLGGGQRRPTLATFELVSSEDGSSLVGRLVAGAAGGSDADEFRPTGYMERVSRALEESSLPLSVRQLRSLVKGGNAYIDVALTALIHEGFVSTESGPRGATLHRSARPFREADSLDAGPVILGAGLVEEEVF